MLWAALTCVLACLQACTRQPSQGGRALNAVVATVNGSVITLQQLQSSHRLRLLNSDGGGGAGAKSEALLLQTTLQDLIERRLLLQAAHQEHMAVFTSEIEAAWQSLMHRWEAQALAASLQTLRQSPLARKEDLRELLLAQKYLREMVDDRVAVMDRDIEQHLALHQELMVQPEQVRLRHMVLADESAAKAALARLRNGESFAAVAGQKSMSPDGVSGGDLGLVSQGQLPESVARVVFALPVRKVSAPMALCDGVHLFYVSERHATRPVPVAQARSRAESELRRIATEQARKSRLLALRQAAHIVVNEVSLEDV